MAAEILFSSSSVSSKNTKISYSSGQTDSYSSIRSIKMTVNSIINEKSAMAEPSGDSSKPNLGSTNPASSSRADHGQQNQNPQFPNMPRLWKRVEINLENSLLNEEKLNNPPSLSDGMSADLERELRFLGCELIQSASILLKLPQVAAATGQVLFQRFYYSKSFVRYNFEQTAMACINLASKIEEHPRRIRDVINVFHHLKQLNRIRESKSTVILNKKPIPMLIDQKYVAIKNEVIKAERRVLKELGFCVHVKHPHKLIFSYLQALRSVSKPNFLQKAWNYMNDSLRSDIFLRYTTETVACACICLASRTLGYPMPSVKFTQNEVDIFLNKNLRFFKPKSSPDSSSSPLTYEWWELFSPSSVNMPDVCRQIWKLYDRKRKPNWEKLENQANKLKQLLIEKQANSKLSGGVENTPNPNTLAPSAAGNNAEKFSPSSRHGSPKAVASKSRDYYNYKDEKANGRIDEYNRKSQGLSRDQSKRRRHRSRSKSPLDSDYPYHQSDYKGSSSRKHYIIAAPPPPGATQSQRQQRRLASRNNIGDQSASSDAYRRSSKRRSDSRSSSPPVERRKKSRKRSRSSSRIRREQEKREREVREALGKSDYNRRTDKDSVKA